MAYKNCMDHLAQWGHMTFRERGFGVVDGLILAVCAYAPFEDLLRDFSARAPLAALLPGLLTRPDWGKARPLMSRQIPHLVERAAGSRRFGSVQLGYVRAKSEEMVQFAAMTWLLPDGTRYLSFRGTDDTLAGWQESFRMAFSAPIPAQQLAAEYVVQVAAREPGKLRLGGHSKGGNLALWAALQTPTPVLRRILSLFSFDGPGLLTEPADSPRLRFLTHRLLAVAPQSSLVGALLHQPPNGQVIYSHGVGLVEQHDPFTWEISGGNLRPLPRRSFHTQQTAHALHTILKNTPPEALDAFVAGLFRGMRGLASS